MFFQFHTLLAALQHADFLWHFAQSHNWYVIYQSSGQLHGSVLIQSVFYLLLSYQSHMLTSQYPQLPWLHSALPPLSVCQSLFVLCPESVPFASLFPVLEKSHHRFYFQKHPEFFQSQIHHLMILLHFYPVINLSVLPPSDLSYSLVLLSVQILW